MVISLRFRSPMIVLLSNSASSPALILASTSLAWMVLPLGMPADNPTTKRRIMRTMAQVRLRKTTSFEVIGVLTTITLACQGENFRAGVSSPARNLIFRNHIYRHYLSKHSQEITSKLSMTSRAALFLISDYDI